MIWGYKKEGGEVISRLFDGDTLPRGWKDTPAAFEDKPSKVKNANGE